MITQDMNLMVWTDEMSVGVSVIDSDHQKIFELLNRLGYSLRENLTYDVLAKVLSELSNYTDYHFQREEILMQVCDYPGIAKHKRIHRILRTQVSKYRSDFMNNPNGLDIVQFRKFLNDWLIEHIMHMDKDYESWMVGKEKELILANTRYEHTLQ